VTADLTEEEALALAETEKIEMIILPGGMPGAANLDASDTVQFFLDKAVAEGAYIASICAAPMIPGKRGLLKGRRATCYPGFEQYLDGAEYTAGRVETDGKMITSCGMGAAVEFGLALTAILKGEPAAETIASAVFAK
jgi:4-methyl-5(b-hydroxyethyl)-thiazole monophosphate biosynthesis